MNTINPYDLLNVTSKSSLKELKKNYYQLSLYCHPDKGGSEEDMIIVHNSYEYIKNQLQNSTEQTYEQLEEEFQEFCKIQENKPPKFCKIFSETHEEWNNEFKNTYSEQKYSNLFDKGYGELMDKSEYQNFNEYQPDDNQKNKHNISSDVVIYQEPYPTPIDIDNNMPLDKKEILDFTYKGMSDYKIAFTPKIESYLEIRERTLDDLLKERNLNKKVLVIYNNSKYSGNYYTGLRISKYFNQSKLHNCEKELLESELNKFDHVIAVNFEKCYQFLKNINLPYTIIFAGTDCNYNELISLEIYRSIFKKAYNIVAFNYEMVSKIKNILYFCNIHNKSNFDYQKKEVKIIPQAVELSFEKKEIEEDDYYLWVGKLRKIKNPELLFKFAYDRSDLKFIMIGDMESIYQNIEFPSNIKYLGIQDRNLVLNYIFKAKALINTSDEEGMSDTILTALGLGVPVMARNNSGNASIISNKTGYLFNTLDDLNNIKINDKNTLNAKIYIHNNHNLSKENLEYQKIIN